MTLSDRILQLLGQAPAPDGEAPAPGVAGASEAPVSAEWVREMMKEHPAFILPGALLVKENPGAVSHEELKDIKLHILLNCSDPGALGDMTDIAGEDWAHLYPASDAPTAPSTESAITTFLDAYGSSSDSETALLEQLIFNPTPVDYFSEDELTAAPSDGSLLPPELRRDASIGSEEAENIAKDVKDVSDVTIPAIEKPTQNDREDHRATENAGEGQKAPQRADDTLLSESLAKIFIKQRRYQRAYEIITNLSLNFPEKSVYFADQLRFLQKLIKNQQYQQQNK